MMDNKSYLKNITHLKFLINNVVFISLQMNVIFNLVCFSENDKVFRYDSKFT